MRICKGLLALVACGCMVGSLWGMFSKQRREREKKWPLLVAVEKGSLDKVKQALKENWILINQQDQGLSAIKIAARKGDLKIVKFLLARGADVCAGDGDYPSVLMHAIPPKTDKRGITQRSNQVDIINALIGKGADVNAVYAEEGTTPLTDAAQYGSAGVVKILCDHGANVNAQVRSSENEGDTPLMLAINSAQRDGIIEVVEELLASEKINLEIKNARGYTALDVALIHGGYEGNAEIAKMLLDKGVVFDKETLVRAARVLNTKALAVLLDGFAKKTVEEQKTAIEYALSQTSEFYEDARKLLSAALEKLNFN
ncbi:MAG: ankyrin repeat domain-containing protein [Candidatus Babeliales bacterium]